MKLGQFYRDRGKEALALKHFEHALIINHAQDPSVPLHYNELRSLQTPP